MSAKTYEGLQSVFGDAFDPAEVEKPEPVEKPFTPPPRMPVEPVHTSRVVYDFTFGRESKRIRGVGVVSFFTCYIETFAGVHIEGAPRLFDRRVIRYPLCGDVLRAGLWALILGPGV